MLREIHRNTLLRRGVLGQVLIESMVAISVVMIGLLGIMTLLIRSSRWNRDATQELVATSLAAEGIEIVKNLVDTNIADRLRGQPVQWNEIPSGVYAVSYRTRFDPAR